MSEKTPLQKLDEAIHEYLAEISDEVEPPQASGWVLAYQTTSYIEDPTFLPVAHHTDYSLGAGTSGDLAIGMMKVISTRMLDYLV